MMGPTIWNAVVDPSTTATERRSGAAADTKRKRKAV